MFGLDDQIAALADGAGLTVILAVAMLLGLRHATDPDHLAAVTALVAGDDEQGARRAGRLGLAWGAGHATSLFVFGIPIVLAGAYLPDPVQMGAEAAVGLVIIALAVRLLARYRAGTPGGDHVHAVPARTRRGAYAIGLVHGMGGTAGFGVLLLATIPGHAEALAAMALFAACTAISMALASTTFGVVLSRDAVVQRASVVIPAGAVLSLAFGAWYALGALQAVPYLL